MVFKKTGSRYLGARPSKKAMSTARKRISQLLWRGRTERMDIHVAQRVRNLLRRRHKLPTSTARFTYDEVHRNLGVLELQSLLR